MTERDMELYKKEILYRKANGKKIHNDYLRKIASLLPLKDQWETLSLEETDAILNRFRDASARLLQRKRQISLQEIHLVIAGIKQVGGPFYILIDEDWKYCGMLISNGVFNINSLFYFDEKILNDVIFISSDMSMAVSLDFFEVNGKSLIDVTEWQA
ncbi:hypothetical protein [Robbsia sp. KACC 23696]|uniref:hypothetical protein n=1 Tax=Robbsia sp. KACC 23696 TaxID=3149231 RepID=UPI00325B2AA7